MQSVFVPGLESVIKEEEGKGRQRISVRGKNQEKTVSVRQGKQSDDQKEREKCSFMQLKSISSIGSTETAVDKQKYGSDQWPQTPTGVLLLLLLETLTALLGGRKAVLRCSDLQLSAQIAPNCAPTECQWNDTRCFAESGQKKEGWTAAAAAPMTASTGFQGTFFWAANPTKKHQQMAPMTMAGRKGEEGRKERTPATTAKMKHTACVCVFALMVEIPLSNYCASIRSLRDRLSKRS